MTTMMVVVVDSRWPLNALSRNSRARTANEETAATTTTTRVAESCPRRPPNPNGNGGLPSTSHSLEKEGDCGRFVA